MRRVMFGLGLALAVMAEGSSIGDDRAKADAGVTGKWEGMLKISDALQLPITLEIESGKNGGWTGSWGSPDEGLEHLPLATISFAEGVLEFTTKHGVTFHGKANPAGSEVAGEWTQRGRAFPLTFRRPDPSRSHGVEVVPKELEGFWEGPLTVNAAIQLRLVLKVEKDSEGRLKASLVSVDQGAANIPISTISLKGDTLTFACRLIGATYTGNKRKDGTGFEGHFTQRGMKMPLVLKRTSALSVARRPQTPKPPFLYRSEEVSYQSGDGKVTLAGSLTIPPGTGPFPAVLLITGSGAQDRDETILGHKPFLLLADTLTRRGVCVLRVDDRGVGGSTGSLTASTLDDLARDAMAGVSYLKTRKEVDPARIGLIGHSEGGLIAPLVASRSKDVAFIVLLAGTGLPGIDILKAQGRLIGKAMGLSTAELDQAADVQRQAIEIFLNEKDEKVARTKLEESLKRLREKLPESARIRQERVGGIGGADSIQRRSVQ